MAEKQREKLVEVESALRNRAKEPGFWREIWQQVRLVVYLLRDPEVPFYLKLLPLAALLYVLFPFDLLPDLAPILGQVDDLTAVLVSSKVFVEMAPPALVAHYMKLIRQRDGFAQDGETAAEKGSDDVADAIIIDTDHEVIVEKRGPEIDRG
jgi:uncharacterized membrane protein YkvA (DUF1232 family)